MPLGEACARLFERMPLPKANFCGIVIAIQQKSGGNLSEALGNPSRCCATAKMAEKIQAMSMEAKASAAIIGSLPPSNCCLRANKPRFSRRRLSVATKPARLLPPRVLRRASSVSLISTSSPIPKHAPTLV
jgi:hypothetical protein